MLSPITDTASRPSPIREGKLFAHSCYNVYIYTGGGPLWVFTAVDAMSPGDSSDWEYIEVVISRPPGQNQSFGFSIAGGFDAPQENGDPSIFVTRIAPGGIAEADNRLR